MAIMGTFPWSRNKIKNSGVPLCHPSHVKGHYDAWRNRVAMAADWRGVGLEMNQAGWNTEGMTRLARR